MKNGDKVQNSLQLILILIFLKVDNEIYEIVKPFLYNGGEGKKIPISKLIRLRNRERPPDKRIILNKNSFDYEAVDEEDDEYRLNIRWRITNFFRRLKPNGFRRRSNDYDSIKA